MKERTLAAQLCIYLPIQVTSDFRYQSLGAYIECRLHYHSNHNCCTQYTAVTGSTFKVDLTTDKPPTATTC
jgi:hypothetical protein